METVTAMVNITANPIIDIKKFLTINSISIPPNTQKTYELALNIIQSNDVKSAPISVIDYVIALNLFNQGIKLSKYNASSILTMNENDLKPLALKLTLPNTNKERVIRILSYLKILNNDMSIFDKLPDETLNEIIGKLDCKSVFLMCKMSTRLTNFCQKEIKPDKGFIPSSKGYIIRSPRETRLESTLKHDFEQQGFNVKNYNVEKLGFMCNMSNRKHPTITGYSNILNILLDGKIYNIQMVNDLDDELIINPILINLPDIIQILQYGDNGVFALTANGHMHNINTNKHSHQIINDINNIVYMIPETNFSVINANGQVYNLKFKANYIDIEFAIEEILEGTVDESIGECTDLILKDDRRVYIKNFRGLTLIPELNDIIDISSGDCHSLAATSDGLVYSWGNHNYGQLGLGTQDNSN